MSINAGKIIRTKLRVSSKPMPRLESRLASISSRMESCLPSNPQMPSNVLLPGFITNRRHSVSDGIDTLLNGPYSPDDLTAPADIQSYRHLASQLSSGQPANLSRMVYLTSSHHWRLAHEQLKPLGQNALLPHSAAITSPEPREIYLWP